MKHTIILFVLLGSAIAGAQQYQLTPAFPLLPAFSRPLDLQHSPDGSGRLFVVQQRGLIYLFDNNEATASRKVFLDLSGKVSQSGGETGLLGLAFHPQFLQNGYVYVNYTAVGSGVLRSYISRFQASGANHDTILLASEKVFLQLYQPFENHNGGWIAFGPDNYLYMSFGDGGSFGDPLNRAQNKDSLLGKILRIDVDNEADGKPYAIPPTNPFAATGGRKEIYAYGLRNAWRCSFDAITNKLWAGDVGQDKWEEIDTIINGGNYGWHVKEGYHCYSPSSGCDSVGFQSPIWEYVHGNSNQSISGGYVYRGSSAPGLSGKYIYADYVSGRIWALTYEGLSLAQNELVFDMPTTVSSFGVDGSNELYIVAYGEGKIYKITETAGVFDHSLKLEPDIFVDQVSKTLRVINPLNNTGGIEVFDLLGRKLELFEGLQPETGRYNLSGLPAGTYFVAIRAGDMTFIKKFIL